MEQNNTPNVPTTEKTERMRRNLLHLLCGGYLCYLAWQLGTSFAANIGQTGWTAMTVMSLVGTIVFAVVGCVLLVRLVQRVITQAKNDLKKENT